MKLIGRGVCVLALAGDDTSFSASFKHCKCVLLGGCFRGSFSAAAAAAPSAGTCLGARGRQPYTLQVHLAPVRGELRPPRTVRGIVLSKYSAVAAATAAIVRKVGLL